MSNEKELKAMTMLSDPEREKVCRKAQKEKKKKRKPNYFLTPKELILTLSGSIMIFMIMYWSGCFMY